MGGATKRIKITHETTTNSIIKLKNINPMAFEGSFSISQGTDISSFVITDTSTGSDANITARTIYLYQTDGSLLSGAPIDWPLDQDTFNVMNVLDKDYSLSISVSWTSSDPISGSTYTKQEITTFTGYTNAFIYYLIQQMAAPGNPNIVSDEGFYDNLNKLQTEVDSAVQCTNYSDQHSAQYCLDRAYFLISNKKYFF